MLNAVVQTTNQQQSMTTKSILPLSFLALGTGSLLAEDEAVAEKKAAYLAAYPKAKLYFDFGDFRMVEFTVKAAFLNGGFGQAFHLTPDDLRP